MDKTTRAHLQELQLQLEDAVESMTKSDLVQCARLLATYLALYKQQYGELTNREYAILNRRLAENIEFGELIYCYGLKELLETLALVELHGPKDETAWLEPRTIN